MRAVNSFVSWVAWGILALGLIHIAQTDFDSVAGPQIAGPSHQDLPLMQAVYFGEGRETLARSIRLVVDTSGKADGIEPYTGPPIYLEEPNVPPPTRIGPRTVMVEKYDDGSPRIERTVFKYSDDSFVADGPYREYYMNGHLFVEGDYKEGRREGEWTYWHKNGEKNRTMNYVDGLPQGTWKVYRADGTLAIEETYKEGKRDGHWVRYDDAGKQPLREESYNNGKFEGEWKFWFPSGQLKQSLHFKNGKMHGLSTEFDEEGNKVVEITFSDGKRNGPTTRWQEDGTKIEQIYKDGRLVQDSRDKQ